MFHGRPGSRLGYSTALQLKGGTLPWFGQQAARCRVQLVDSGSLPPERVALPDGRRQVSPTRVWVAVGLVSCVIERNFMLVGNDRHLRESIMRL